MQKATAREITEELKPIKEGIENLPQAFTFPAYPSITAFEKPLEEEDAQYIGESAKRFLRKSTTKDEADKTYGLYDKDGKFYIGNKKVKIKENNIEVKDGKKCEGTLGLWELIVSKEPKNFTEEDYENYTKLMV